MSDCRPQAIPGLSTSIEPDRLPAKPSRTQGVPVIARDKEDAAALDGKALLDQRIGAWMGFELTHLLDGDDFVKKVMNLSVFAHPLKHVEVGV